MSQQNSNFCGAPYKNSYSSSAVYIFFYLLQNSFMQTSYEYKNEHELGNIQ